jgi:ribonuclease T
MGMSQLWRAVPQIDLQYRKVEKVTDSKKKDFYISVDVETAGPTPGDYSLLSIGACTVLEPPNTFYVELKPENENALPEALAISRLSIPKLMKSGLEPVQAMTQFKDWLEQVVPSGHRPVFLAFNAPFDWMFVNDYFYRYLGYNPFGHAALDIKAFYMGLTGVAWNETSMQHVTQRYFGERQLTHHALRDALDQSELFLKMLAEAASTNR